MNARWLGCALILFFLAALAPPSLAGCSAPPAKYEAATAGVQTVDKAIQAFVAWDAEQETKIAIDAIAACNADAAVASTSAACNVDGSVAGATSEGCAARAARNACIDREVATRRREYDRKKEPVRAAIIAYRVALRMASVAANNAGGDGGIDTGQWTGAISQSAADIFAALAALGVKVPS
jgi:hypothetical protein